MAQSNSSPEALDRLHVAIMAADSFSQIISQTNPSFPLFAEEALSVFCYLADQVQARWDDLEVAMRSQGEKISVREVVNG